MTTPSMSDRLRSVLTVVLALAMVAIGVVHFVAPAPFVYIVPRWLPAPLALVYISGVFEVLGGVGLLVPRARRAAAYGLVALYIAVFPANVNMAVHHLGAGPGGPALPAWALWGRLPLQLVLIALALWIARGARPIAPRPGRP